MHENNKSFTENLTPVRFLQSPRTKFPAGDANLLVCKERLDIIIKSLQDNFAKWKLAQKRGLTLCQAIEAIKTRHMEDKSTEACLYPTEMKPHCDKLSTISQIFNDIVKNTKIVLDQLKALKKLNKNSQEVYYRTWTMTQFIDFVSQVLESYESEAKIKQKIMHELPHCLNRADLIHCTTAWEYPQYVDDWLTMLFLFINQETK